MMNHPAGRIVEVRFLHEIRNGKIVGQSQIFGTFEDGLEYPVISYYADEIWFSEDELIGLTFESAINLFLKKDTTYLRS
jgi:hypothetical protein